jgi:hypothetical protein
MLNPDSYSEAPQDLAWNWKAQVRATYIMKVLPHSGYKPIPPFEWIRNAAGFLKDFTEMSGGSERSISGPRRRYLSEQLVGPALFEWVYGETMLTINDPTFYRTGELRADGTMHIFESHDHYYRRTVGWAPGEYLQARLTDLDRRNFDASTAPDVVTAREAWTKTDEDYRSGRAPYEAASKAFEDYQRVLNARRQTELGAFESGYRRGYRVGDGAGGSLPLTTNHPGYGDVVITVRNPHYVGRPEGHAAYDIPPALANYRPWFANMLFRGGVFHKNINPVLRDMLGDRRLFYAVFALEHKLLENSEGGERLLARLQEEIKTKMPSKEAWEVFSIFSHLAFQINDPTLSYELNLLRKNEVAAEVVAQLAQWYTPGQAVVYKGRSEFPVAPWIIRRMRIAHDYRVGLRPD